MINSLEHSNEVSKQDSRHIEAHTSSPFPILEFTKIDKIIICKPYAVKRSHDSTIVRALTQPLLIFVLHFFPWVQVFYTGVNLIDRVILFVLCIRGADRIKKFEPYRTSNLDLKGKEMMIVTNNDDETIQFRKFLLD